MIVYWYPSLTPWAKGGTDLPLGGDLQETPNGPRRESPGLQDEGDPLQPDGLKGLRLVRKQGRRPPGL